MEYCLGLERNEVPIHPTTWVNLAVMLNWKNPDIKGHIMDEGFHLLEISGTGTCSKTVD